MRISKRFIKTTKIALVLLLFASASSLQARQENFGVIKLSAPAYPPSELKAGHEGTTQILVSIDKDGNVASAVIHKSSGWPKLDSSALASVKSGKFRPATDKDGNTIASSGVIPITFDSPYESVDSQRAYLERYLSTPCDQYLSMLKAEQLKEPSIPPHMSYTFKWPLLLAAELLRAEGKSNKADTLMARSQAVYNQLVQNCAKNPGSTTYTQLNLAIKKAQ